MKALIFTFLICFASLSKENEIYKSGENTGQGKVERLDRSEKYLEEVSLKVIKLESEVKSLKQELELLKLKVEQNNINSVIPVKEEDKTP